MKSLSLLAALSLFFSLSAGCSMSHGDPDNPKKNPHPLKRYEVIATADAPGPWDKVIGRVFYDVINKECTPENNFLGVHITPKDVAIDFEMNHVSEKVWRGYFYRDAVLAENYYGLGICHWDTTSVSVGFIGSGVPFSSGSVFERFLKKSSQTEYFKKSDYGNKKSMSNGALGYSEVNPEYSKNPSEFFPVTVTVKEVAP
ncbi:hypothetical protein [Xanthomonas sp. MUS 060]|uniref:hypothetical protein n=1 Tax=Xanthomonas sp. MUS 060 TaxID=1588031 RepID=UPI000A68B264|nr:hypothetical protein [Xanthomonas sp. MUS 060]